MKKIVVYFCITLFSVSIGLAQEVLLPLSGNPLLNKKKTARHQLKSTVEAVKLPFIDDFSNYSLYPDSNLWADNYVFVNTQFAINPPTIGVATFDALNQNGIIYPSALISQFSSDTLTSQPIRLDSVFTPALKAIKLSDSLYFSFYFQPAGGRGAAWERLGDAPEAEDSLVLEFYCPVCQADTQWNRIWSTKGMPLDTIFKADSNYFKYVIIPINDTAKYYKNGFRFRFRNYSSLGNNIIPSWAGNCDQWNIDYVYLGISRTINDTVRKDLTFIERAPSFLKNYQSMPASQFVASEINDTISNKISNLDGIAHASSYKYEIRNQLGNVVANYDGGFFNIDSYWTNGYQQYNFHARPPVVYNFPLAVGTKSWYEIRHLFKEGISQDFRPQNDTNIFIQKFDDYYAYDDGTAENGYGLTPAGSKLAYQFNLNKTDTLVAVEIYFNSTLNNSNLKYFNLCVWNDNGSGKPGDTIYRSNPILPIENTENNKFQKYILNRNLIVNGKIYVGMIQTTDDNLNIGFDRNTSSESHIFYNSSGNWNQSFLKGSLMIRPVFGVEYLGINEMQKGNFTFEIFPNPLKNDNLQIKLQSNTNIQNQDYSLQIFDILGNKVYQSVFENQIMLSNFSNGVYFIKVSNVSDGIQQTKKLIITR